MISAMGVDDLDYRSLMKKCVCDGDIENVNCMLQKCDKWPGVKTYLQSLEKLQERESVKYHQWTGTDRVEMKESVDNIDDFVEKLSEDIYNLTLHHIISRQQLDYLKELKSNLPEKEAIILGDFAMNYSVVLQNEVESAHCTNIQVLCMHDITS